MVTISKQEMERVLRLPGIASRDQNRVEVSGQQLYYSEGKVHADYSNKKRKQISLCCREDKSYNKALPY